MDCQSAPPASAPEPRLTARSMLSLGTEDFFAFWTASYRVGFPARSPPPVRAATSMFLISFAKSLARLESMTAFLCLVVAHLEWPDIANPTLLPPNRLRGHAPGRRSTRAAWRHPSSRGGTTWPAADRGEPRRSYPSPGRTSPSTVPPRRARPAPPRVPG